MYDLFKFLHIVGAIVWVGAGVTFQILNARLARADDRAGVTALAGQGEWFGRTVFSTAAVVTLVSGVITVLASDGAWGFGDFWVTWGFVGIALSIVSGAVLSQRTATDLAATIAEEGPASSRVAELQRRLGMIGAVDLVILFSVVAAMVFKPGA